MFAWGGDLHPSLANARSVIDALMLEVCFLRWVMVCWERSRGGRAEVMLESSDGYESAVNGLRKTPRRKRPGHRKRSWYSRWKKKTVAVVRLVINNCYVRVAARIHG